MIQRHSYYYTLAKFNINTHELRNYLPYEPTEDYVNYYLRLADKSAKNKYIVKELYSLGFTQKQIAEMLDISQPMVSKHLKAELTKEWKPVKYINALEVSLKIDIHDTSIAEFLSKA